MFKKYSISRVSWTAFINKISIIDDDFEEEIDDDIVLITYIVRYLIKIYSRRNLNVAYNLILFMRFEEKMPTAININDQIEYYTKVVEEFRQYLPEINKYMAII